MALNFPVLADITENADTTHIHLMDCLLVHAKQVNETVCSQNDSRASTRDVTVAEDKPVDRRLVACLPITH